MFADWQDFADKKNAKQVRNELEKIFKLIHEKAKIEADYLFHHGMQIGSASLI